MSDDLLRRINEALDTPEGLEGDAELSRTFSDDPEAAAIGAEMSRIEGALREWPEPERSDEAMEALAVRVGQRLDEDLMPMDDPTEPPEFEPEPGEEVRQKGSGHFSLQNLANLRTTEDDEIDLVPIEGPPPAARLPQRKHDRFSLTDVVSQMGPSRAGPPLQFLSAPPPEPTPAPPDVPSSRGPVLWGGLAIAAVLGLAVVGGMSMMGDDAAESPIAAAPDMAAQGRMQAEAEEAPAEPAALAGGGAPTGVASQDVGAPGEGSAGPAAAVAEAEPAEGATAPAEEPSPELAPSPMRRARESVGTSQPSSPRTTMRSPMAEPTTGRRPASMRGATSAVPDSPSREDVQAALRAVAPVVAACGGGARRGVATVEITVGSSGRVRNAVVTGPFAGTPEGSCIARAARRARFPQFGQPTFRVTYPFRL